MKTRYALVAVIGLAFGFFWEPLVKASDSIALVLGVAYGYLCCLLLNDDLR